MNKLKLAVVIVSFNPVWVELKSLVENLISNHEVNVFIVDNNSNDAVAEFSLFPQTEMLTISFFPENVGIAAAQNHGLKLATSNDCLADYIFLFDQDSQIESGFINNMLAAYQSLNDKYIAAIGPIFSDSRYGFYYPIIEMSNNGFRTKINPQYLIHPFRASMLIASGMMINTVCLNKIGFMDETLFIDYVDTEWCLRAIAKGYSFYAIPNVRMKHAIGDDNIKLFKWRVPIHSSFRRYYRIRNSFYLLKLPHVPKLMSIREVFFSVIHQMILVFLGRDAKNQIKCLFRGVFDGLRFLCTKK